jgi:hypothetical protein
VQLVKDEFNSSFVGVIRVHRADASVIDRAQKGLEGERLSIEVSAQLLSHPLPMSFSTALGIPISLFFLLLLLLLAIRFFLLLLRLWRDVVA